jgi:hypothetical protein
MVCVEAYRDQDHLFRFDDEDEARLVGLFLAELAVDHFCSTAGVLPHSDEHRLGR